MEGFLEGVAELNLKTLIFGSDSGSELCLVFPLFTKFSLFSLSQSCSLPFTGRPYLVQSGGHEVEPSSALFLKINMAGICQDRRCPLKFQRSGLSQVHFGPSGKQKSEPLGTREVGWCDPGRLTLEKGRLLGVGGCSNHSQETRTGLSKRFLCVVLPL